MALLILIGRGAHNLQTAIFAHAIFAEVVKLVDTHVSGACVARHAGSSPALGTKPLFFRAAFLFHGFLVLPLCLELQLFQSPGRFVLTGEGRL